MGFIADKTVAAPSLAAFCAFKEIGKTLVLDLEIGRDGRFNVSKEALMDRDEISLMRQMFKLG
jgi:hypothetical protein